jgi:hypothetical protein
MTLGFTPAVVHLDGGAAAGLWDRLLAADPRPRPILVTADVRARLSGWAPHAIMVLADALAQRLPTVTVIDLQLDDPQLHRIAGIRNEEGIADALLFGASIEHLAHVGPGHHARVVPAGAYIPSPGEVFASPGWARVIEEAAAGGGGLLLYVPLESPLGTLARHVDRSIALRGDPATAATASLSTIRLLAIVSPPPVAAVAPSADEQERARLIADLRARQSAALVGVAGPGDEPRRPVMGATAARESRIVLGEPPTTAKRSLPLPARRHAILWGTLAALVVALLAGMWHYVGRDFLERRQEAAQRAGLTAPSLAAAEPADEPLPYSVAIEAHEELPVALARVNSLSADQAGMGFYVAPLLQDSDLFYRVMAGPVRDSTTAAAVMDTLVARGEKTGRSEYDIRSTPLAFLLGEFGTREEATRRMSELLQLQIPSYVVEMPFTVGPSRYRLYSGAYAGPAEADVMRQLLQNTGLPDSLVLRTGRSGK